MKDRVNLSVLSQIAQLLPSDPFRKLVKDHDAERYSKGVSSRAHMISMLFCQLAQCGGLRDIEKGLRSSAGDQNHLGIEEVPGKSTLSYMNQHRPWQLFPDHFQVLLDELSGPFKNNKIPGLKIRRKVFALDSTLVSLCLELFDWAQYKQQKGACKIHAVVDYHGFLPTYAVVTDGKTSDIEVAKDLEFPKGSVVVVDRTYVDTDRFRDLDSKGSHFVTRMKSNIEHKASTVAYL